MTDDNRISLIPALWFDRRGCGPDELALELHHFPSDLGGRIPAYLGIRVRASGLVIGAGPLIDGGFNVDRDGAADLHRQIGAWLAANPPAGATVDDATTKWRRVAVGGTDITEHVAAMFDALVASLDWGSMFLATDDVESIVTVADLVGFEIPMVDRGPVPSVESLAKWRAQIAAKAAARSAEATQASPDASPSGTVPSV